MEKVNRRKNNKRRGTFYERQLRKLIQEETGARVLRVAGSGSTQDESADLMMAQAGCKPQLIEVKNTINCRNHTITQTIRRSTNIKHHNGLRKHSIL